MKKVLDELNRLEERLLTVLLPTMCIMIFIATFLRFTKILIIPWAEELARYCMVWIIFLGISAGAKKGEHFYVSAAITMLPKPLRNVMAVIRTLILVAFNVFVAYYCNIIIRNQVMMEQVTPSLKWPMWVIYLAIPIGCILMAVRYAWYTYLEITGKVSGEGGESV